MDQNNKKEELLRNLAQATGTEYYHWYYSLLMTDGVLFLCENAECFWLMGVIWSVQNRLAEHDMVVVTLEVHEDRSATFKAVDRDVLVYEQVIPWTDFVLDSITLYVIDGVVLLPSEY